MWTHDDAFSQTVELAVIEWSSSVGGSRSSVRFMLAG